ncbi:hypothetical protein BC937DRAFT_89699 [Endogone sp. FLAS-F59071]|nr:hypothetical protein BC937DRAFT_89699 [Endogone sp. FLAS-F59071]|eukprot:RUS17633.1 hypothetical protein BC937DRAFT_89699 [Endogone sp. FLAS-F59071]
MQHNTQENYSFPDLDLGFSLDHMDDFDLFKTPHPSATHADAGAAYLYSDSPASLTGLSAPVPFLTPDNSDGSHTDSALLMGRDPEYVGMSPLQMSPSGLEMPSQHGGIMTDDGFIDEEGFFTPLVSPAMTPSFGSLHAPSSNMMAHDMFSPLASPALHPQSLHHLSRHHGVATTTAYSPLHSPIIFGHSMDQQIVAHLQQKLANIQQQEQQSKKHGTQSLSSTPSPILPSSSSQGEMSESSRAPKTLRKTKQSPLVKPTSSPYEQSQQRRARKKRATPQQQSMPVSPHTQGNVLVAISPKLSASMSMPPPMQPLTAGQNVLVSPAPKAQPSQQQSTNNTTIPAAALPQTISTGKPRIIAPATPASLMKLGGGGPPISNTIPPSSIASSSADMLPAPMISLPPPPPSKHPGPIFVSPSIHPTARLMLSPVPKPLLSPRSAPTGPGDTALSSPKTLKSSVPASPRALKPLISPSLKPLLPGMIPLPADAAASILANKSNYQNLLEGKAQSLGMTFSPAIHTGIEIRRTAHKAAEQKRRDSLKQSFENLRKEVLEALVSLPAPAPSTVDTAAKEESVQDDGAAVICGAGDADVAGKDHETDKEDKSPEALNQEREKQVKQMSKVALLKHSYEYILRLKRERIRKDERIARLESEVRKLRRRCGLPEVTEEEECETIRIREEEEMMALVKREEIGGERDEDEDEDVDMGT